MRATHLRCACDHVLHIVCMAWAIYMGVVPLVCLVLDCATWEVHISTTTRAGASFVSAPCHFSSMLPTSAATPAHREQWRW